MCRRDFIARALALAAWLPASASAQDAGTPLRVMTWNIYWANADLDATVDVISDADADVVLLQETSEDSEAHLSDGLKDRYPEIVYHGHEGNYGAERFGLLSKLPVDEVKFLPPQRGLFGQQVARIKVGEQTVQFINVHLQPVILERAGGVANAAQAFMRAETIHSHEIEDVMAHWDDSLPTIIAGDFNSMSPFIAPATLRRKGFVDAFAAGNEQPDAHPTFRIPLRTADFTARIDYIFSSRHFAVGESRVIESNASDHLPVVSDLTLLDNPAP